MIAFFIGKVIKGLQLVKPKIVICVPTGITQVEKRAVVESAQQAGAREVKLIEEPMAAAIGAKLPIDKPMGNMVVDIGGGTTEVAVISLSAVAYAESVRVAGDEMNEAIQRYVREEFKMLIGENVAEKIKIQIGAAIPFKEAKTMRVAGKDMVDGRPKTITISDGQVRESIKEPVNAILMAVRKALEKTPPELVTDVANNGLLLAGGGALLRGLDRLISKDSEIHVLVDDDPLTTVLRGTGNALVNEKTLQSVFIN
jgi:rod shape-determining protein MreB